MADQPKGYVDATYLDLHKVLLDRAKRASYELLHLAPGHHVLDVGCGPATDTISLGRLVGPGGEVVGVDYDVEMVDEANRRAAAAGVGAWVKHRQADAAGLPFESNVFDAARSERVFQYLLDPERALAEMARVTRPGGWIVIMDPDWGTLSIDTPETELERRLTRFVVDRCVNNAYSGRRLLRQFKRQGLEDVKVRVGHLPLTSYALAREVLVLDRLEPQALAAGAFTRDQLARLHTSFEEADRAGYFFASVSGVTVAGRKSAQV